MRKVLIIVAFFCSQVSLSAERAHKLKVVTAGGSKTLSIVDLEKEFPNRASLNTTLQKEPQQKFEGVFLKDLVEKWGNNKVTKIRATATNKYTVYLTVKDWTEWNGLFAWKSNGQPISTKDRGSFRIVYDYAKFAGDRETTVTQETNSVWQIVELELIP